MGRLPFFYGSRELMIKILNYFFILYFVYVFFFLVIVISDIIGSPAKNDSLLHFFIQNCFKCDYDHCNTEYGCTNNFVTLGSAVFVNKISECGN